MSLAKNSALKLDKKVEGKVSLLDLPESTLDFILEFLLPVDLCNVAQVCTSLRRRCGSDDLWEKHIKQKWGGLLGDAAYREWQRHVTMIVNQESPLLQLNPNGLLGSFSGVWPSISLGSYLENPSYFTSFLLSNFSKMALYISIQSGRFWFPAQVYRCVRLFDALISYDRSTNTFRARFPSGGWQLIEENVQWDRLRISPTENPPHALHIRECLNDLKAGDHIEIQRRRRNDQPYDWYHAVIGHLDTCDTEDQNHCGCEYSDVLIVLLTHYRPQSRWRRAVLNKNVHGEQSDGFWLYGGIRKLDNEEEIERWNRLRATQIRRGLGYLHRRRVLQ